MLYFKYHNNITRKLFVSSLNNELIFIKKKIMFSVTICIIYILQLLQLSFHCHATFILYIKKLKKLYTFKVIDHQLSTYFHDPIFLDFE